MWRPIKFSVRANPHLSKALQPRDVFGSLAAGATRGCDEVTKLSSLNHGYGYIYIYIYVSMCIPPASIKWATIVHQAWRGFKDENSMSGFKDEIARAISVRTGTTCKARLRGR